MSKIELVVRTALKLNEAFNRHDVAGMMQLMSDDCTIENASPTPDGSVISGKEEVTRYWQDFFHNSPGAHIEIEEIFGLGERCIMRWIYSWSGEDSLEGYVRGVDIFRVRNGLILEILSYIKG